VLELMLKSVAYKEVIMTVNDEKLRILNGKRCNLRANDNQGTTLLN